MFQEFIAQWGAEWYKLTNSQMWKDAKAALREHSAAANLTGVTPAEIATLGVVFAANIQGQMDVLQTMETLMIAPEGGTQAPRETYAPGNEDDTPEQEQAASPKPPRRRSPKKK